MTARAFAAIKARLSAPTYAALQVLWVDQYQAPPQNDGQPIPWVLAEVLFGLRGTSPGIAGQRLKRQAGVLRLFVCVPKGAGSEADLPYGDALATLFDHQDLPTSLPDEIVRMQDASVISADDIAADLKGVYGITLVSVPFVYFHFE